MTMTDPYRIDTRDLVEELRDLEARDDKGNDELDREAAIKDLLEEIGGYAGDQPEDGIFLIADSEFEDYARELAEDIGAIDPNASYNWPLSCIDWERAAHELQVDYTSVEFDGITYWYR